MAPSPKLTSKPRNALGITTIRVRRAFSSLFRLRIVVWRLTSTRPLQKELNSR